MNASEPGNSLIIVRKLEANMVDTPGSTDNVKPDIVEAAAVADATENEETIANRGSTKIEKPASPSSSTKANLDASPPIASEVLNPDVVKGVAPAAAAEGEEPIAKKWMEDPGQSVALTLSKNTEKDNDKEDVTPLTKNAKRDAGPDNVTGTVDLDTRVAAETAANPGKEEGFAKRETAKLEKGGLPALDKNPKAENAKLSSPSANEQAGTPIDDTDAKSPSPAPETKKRNRSAASLSPSNSGSPSGEPQKRARSNKSRRLDPDAGPAVPTEKVETGTVEDVTVLAAAAESDEAVTKGKAEGTEKGDDAPSSSKSPETENAKSGARSSSKKRGAELMESNSDTKSRLPGPDTKKRNRSATPSSPSNSGSASGERQTRGSGKSRRRLNLDVAPGILTEGLDPDTVEAVAVAAAAEKEEAIAKRRTTRLAAGKIDKVDYNASGVPKPAANAEADESDGEFMGIEPVADEPRKSRRREAAEKEKQRTSRRQAKKRTSREQSPGRNGGESGDGRGSKRGSRNSSRNGDSDGMKRGSSLGKDDTADIENEGDNGSGFLLSENDLDEADRFSAVSMSDREDEKGWTILTLSAIANTVKKIGSTCPNTIASDMRRERLLSNLELTERDIVEKLTEVIEEIKRVNSKPEADQDYTVEVNEILSFFASDVSRLSSGHPRPMFSTQRQIERMEKGRTGLEKKKRRVKREFEEALNKLESEMEARRKADLDASFATLHRKELERESQRETESKAKLQKEIRHVQAQEDDGQKRMERTKRLFSKLVQSAKDNDTPKVDLPTPAGNTDGASSSKKPRQQHSDSANTVDSNGTIGESITSDEDRMDVDGDAGQAGNMPQLPIVASTSPDPRRLAELERLRSLVRDRAREAAECQRICEIEHLKHMALLDAKNKLDHELYTTRNSLHDYGHHTGSSAGLHSSVPPLKTKDSGRRGDKGGSLKHANGGPKGKGGASKSGNAAMGHGVKNSAKKQSKKDEKAKRKTSSKPTATSNA